MTGSAFTVLHKPHNHLHPKCSHPPKADPVPISCHLRIPGPQRVVTINPLSVSMDFPVLDVSYKWNHGQRGLWCLLPSLSVVSSRSIQVVAGVRAPFLYVAEFYAPPYGRTTFCTSIHPPVEIGVVSMLRLL